MSEKYIAGEFNSGTGILTATDYTVELGRIATALESFVSIADQMNTNFNAINSTLNTVVTIANQMNTNFTAINSSLNTVAQKISSIENLASGEEGIHTVGPYDWLNGADLYNWYALGNRQLSIDPITISSLTNYISTATFLSPYFPKFK